MRRPAQFSGAAPLEPSLAVLPSAPATAKTIPARGWQDDGKFAVTLLALVIFVNLLLTFWLTAITPKPVIVAPPAATHAMPRVDENGTHELSSPDAEQ